MRPLYHNGILYANDVTQTIDTTTNIKWLRKQFDINTLPYIKYGVLSSEM